MIEIKLNPKNPRKISKEKLDKLKKSIKDFPAMLELRPIIVNSKGIILGGNMRYKALTELGYEIKEEWVKVAESLTADEERRFIIEDNVEFGEWDTELLSEEWDSEALSEWGLELPETGDDDFYTSDIKAPIYEPTGEKHKIEELVDMTKTDKLIKEIEESNLTDEEKKFLILAATRHYVFDYSKIANFYASASKETQDLMEKSALVIIDFDKAIENGYVKMIGDIINTQKEDYDE